MKSKDTELHVCENCGTETTNPKYFQDEWSIPGLAERVEPGETFPTGECNDCGCLTHARRVN